MKKYIEIQGYTTRAAFVRRCKNLMNKRGYESWIEHFESYLQEAKEIRQGEKSKYYNDNTHRDSSGQTCKEIWGSDFNEINANDGYSFQTYYKHDTDGSSYNIIFEHDGECGYFYMIDTAIANPAA